MTSILQRRTLLAAGAALAAGTVLPARAQQRTLRFAAVFSDKDIRADMMKMFAKIGRASCRERVL